MKVNEINISLCQKNMPESIGPCNHYETLTREQDNPEVQNLHVKENFIH